MIDIGAFLHVEPGRDISAAESFALQRTTQANAPKPIRSSSQGNGLVVVTGDGPIDSCIHAGTRLSVLCTADLLNSSELQAQLGRSVEGPAELVAGLYEACGDSFIHQLRGRFAIILHDRREQVLKAWIDQFGAGRLAYISSQGMVAIASNIQWLRAWSRQEVCVDPESLHEYLQYSCIPAPRTIYRGIGKIEPGHYLVIRPGGNMLASCYWDLKFEVSPERGERAWAGRLFSAIKDSVAASLTFSGNHKVGCFLSGGTDSSSVTALVGQITGTPARSFSIGFEDARYNEIGYARIAAQAYGTDHHEYFVKPDDILRLAQSAAAAFDEPFGNSSIIPTYYCARLAAENGITHLLAGDGGDEIFGGNERYVKDKIFQNYLWFPQWSRQRLLEPVLRTAASLTRARILDLAVRYVRRASIPLPDRLLSYGFLSSVSAGELFGERFLSSLNGSDPLNPARRYYGNAPTNDYLNRWLYLDTKITIGANDLRKVTRMTEMAGVGVRYPLLSPELAEFAGTIPPGLKVKHGQLRYLFKKAMSSVLPPAIASKSKHGFGLPYSVWLGENAPLRDFTFDVLGSTRCRERGYFRKDLLEWLWHHYENTDKTYFGDIFWIFLMLEQWHLCHEDVTPLGKSQQ